MKNFKEFTAEQKYVTEIGPVGALVGALVGGIAAYKGGKALWNKVQGYREASAEKKDNAKRDVYVNIKKWDENEGKVVTKPVLYAKAGTKKARISNDDLEKATKKLQKAEDPKNASKEGERDAADDAAKQERGGIEDVKDAEEYYKNSAKKAKDRTAPSGWVNMGTKTKPELMTTKDADKEEKRRRKVKDKRAKPETAQENKLFKFGEFISEDVMKDLYKISKSKKDMIIKLSDGTEIPIDPTTAEIFVKYIEGLKSSEQKKVINQFQRTERGFMKVLGKAHGE